jgi:shikimate dehydrogenase
MKKLKCGLLGEHLGHSFSPQIHKELADYEYKLFEMPVEDVESFLRSDRFDAINVTIPYKKTVMPYLDEISDEAKRIGSVNTITRLQGGGLKGDNTDYFGFSYMIDKSGIEIKDKKVIILGSGGASETARTVCADRGAREITVISRSGKDNYANLYKHKDADIIINTTPVGMYPHNGASPVELSDFPALEGVLDMIYNPASTKLLLDAKRLGIKCSNGLCMLVAQAKKACELFLGAAIDDGEIDRITDVISAQMGNLVLIGMPGSGKSTIGTMLAQEMGRELIDTDELIVKKAGMTIPEIFAKFGESYFRALEHACVCEAGKESGKIIATGGGVVTRAENYAPLRQNGKLFFITRDANLLPTDGRPISQSTDLGELYRKRLPLYRAFCDKEVSNDRAAEQTVCEIIKLYNK